MRCSYPGYRSPPEEIFLVSLNAEHSDYKSRKINYPGSENFSIESFSFFDKNIAFLVSNVSRSERKQSRLYIADSDSGKIIESIQLPIESAYTPIDDYKDSLLFGGKGDKWHDFISLLDPKRKITKSVLELEERDIQKLSRLDSEYSFPYFNISDQLGALRFSNQFFSQTLILRDFPKVSQVKLFDFGGIADVYESHALVSCLGLMLQKCLVPKEKLNLLLVEGMA